MQIIETPSSPLVFANVARGQVFKIDDSHGDRWLKISDTQAINIHYLGTDPITLNANRKISSIYIK